MLTGDNGILKRAAEAKEENEKAQTDEQGNLKKYDEIISDYTGVDWNIAKANATKHPDQKNSDLQLQHQVLHNHTLFHSNFLMWNNNRY